MLVALKIWKENTFETLLMILVNYVCIHNIKGRSWGEYRNGGCSSHVRLLTPYGVLRISFLSFCWLTISKIDCWIDATTIIPQHQFSTSSRVIPPHNTHMSQTPVLRICIQKNYTPIIVCRPNSIFWFEKHSIST